MVKNLTQNIILAFIFFLLFACQKEKSFEGTLIPQISSWEFKQDTVKYYGNLDTVKIEKQGNLYSLAFVGGPSTSNIDGSIKLGITGNIQPNITYKSSTGEVQFAYFQNGFPLYYSLPNNPSNDFSVIINTITDSTISGTFSGKIQDALLNIKEVSGGKFEGIKK